MPRLRLLALLTSLLLGLPLASAVAAGGTGGTADQPVAGTLVRVADEPGWSGPAYLLRLRDRTLLPVDLAAASAARSGDRVTGTLERPGAGPRRTPVLTVRHAVSRPLARAGARSLVTSSARHRLYLAAPDLGALSRDDAGLESLADRVGAYWRGEANGAIATFTGAAAVTHYASTVAGASGDCGLRSGSTFQELVQEAEEHFPGADFERGSDQLVIFVPAGSCTGGAEGIGYVGTSFASGGVVLAKDGATAEGTLAHEMGHNFGFQHANLTTSQASTEYAGIYEVMGFALSGVNQLTALGTANRVGAGVTDPGEVVTVDPRQDTAPTTRTVTLAPRSAESGVRGLALVDPDTGQTRFLDYRSGGGRDAGAQYTRTGYSFRFGGEQVRFRPGVVVQSAYAGGRGVTYESVGPTVGLVPGDTWTNASGSLVVSLGEQSADSARLTVTFTPSDRPAADGPTPTIGGGPVWTDPLTAQASSPDVPDDVTTSLQWAVDGTPVAGATTSTFAPTAATVGHRVTVSATYAADDRHPTTRTSEPVTVTPATFEVSDGPAVVGAPVVGSTLTARPADVAQTRSALARVLTWRVDGAAVATGPSYLVRAADLGRTVTLTESLAADGYTTRSLVSAATGAVAPGTLSSTMPTITGTAKVGRPLRLVRGAWTAGTAFGYRWYADGRAISGATTTSYAPTKGVRGKRITVSVTGTRPGWTTLTRTSTATGRVTGH